MGEKHTDIEHPHARLQVESRGAKMSKRNCAVGKLPKMCKGTRPTDTANTECDAERLGPDLRFCSSDSLDAGCYWCKTTR